MAATAKVKEENEQAPPAYTPSYHTGTEGEYFCKGTEFEQLKKRIGSIPIGTILLGRIPFDLYLERSKEKDEMGRDVVLNIDCSNGFMDPHWRCSFTAVVECPQSALESDISFFEESMKATRTINTMRIPILKTVTLEGIRVLQIKVNIKVTSWKGFLPENVQSFTEKTDITDATLIVEGFPLYVSRAILAVQSTYFHTLFYNRGFKDASKHEFVLKDVEFDEMQMFLSLVYPNNADEKYKSITQMDHIEDMLALGERFGCDSITRLMEKFLMGENNVDINGWSNVRRLELSDRFRLSAPCSAILNMMRNDDELQKLGDSEEYPSLSKEIKSALLDMRMRRPIDAEFDVSKRPAMIERRQDSSRLDSYHRMLDVHEARRKCRDAQNRAEAAERKRQAAVRPTMLSDDQLAADFETDVGLLPAAVASIALTSAQSDELAAAMRFVQEMSRQEYGQLEQYHRVQLNTHLRVLVSATADLAEGELKANVQTFLSLIQLLRNGGVPPRKRMRVRNFVLRPQP